MATSAIVETGISTQIGLLSQTFTATASQSVLETRAKCAADQGPCKFTGKCNNNRCHNYEFEQFLVK